MVETKRLGVIGSYAKDFTARLTQIKENTTFYLKIRAENKDGYGPFCDTVKIQPPTTVSRVAPNITYKILSPGLVRLSWACPQVFNAFITSFVVRFTNNVDLPEKRWHMQRVVPASAERFPNFVTTDLAVDQYKTCYIKVCAEYDDHISGEWSKIIKIATNGQGKLTDDEIVTSL